MIYHFSAKEGGSMDKFEIILFATSMASLILNFVLIKRIRRLQNNGQDNSQIKSK